MNNSMTLYDRLLNQFRKDGGLTAVEDAELKAIMIEAGVDKNDTFWTLFLPLYLNQLRSDDLKESALFSAIPGADEKPKIDVDKLAASIVARIEPDQINAEIDALVVARNVAKLAAPEIENVVSDAISKIQKQSSAPLDAQAIKREIHEATKASMLNRNLIVSVVCGLLMSVLSGYYASYKADASWSIAYVKQQQEIKELKMKVEAGNGK